MNDKEITRRLREIACWGLVGAVARTLPTGEPTTACTPSGDTVRSAWKLVAEAEKDAAAQKR